MAKVEELVVLNPADKTRMYSVATGKGAPADADDPIVSDVKTFPVGSQYTDLTNKKFYVRMVVSATPAASDWTSVSGT